MSLDGALIDVQANISNGPPGLLNLSLKTIAPVNKSERGESRTLERFMESMEPAKGEV